MQLPLDLQNSTNAILVHASALDGLLDRLSNGYDQQDAYDLYELILHIVLRDRLWFSPTVSSTSYSELMQPWFRSGVALWMPKRIGLRVAKANLATTLISRSTTMVGRQRSELTMLARLASEHELPCFVTAEHRRLFERIALVDEENAVCDLVAQCMSVERAARSGVLRRGLTSRRLVNFRIPPVSLEVIRRSRNIEDVVWRALEVRDEYSRMRREFGELNQAISDSSVSPNAKLRLISDLKRNWNGVYRLADGAIQFDSAKSGGYLTALMASGAQFGAGFALHDIGSMVSGLVGIGASSFTIGDVEQRQRNSRWRLQPLGNTIRNYWAASDRDMISHLERVFGPPRIY